MDDSTYCQICQVLLRGIKSAGEHYAGKQHRKKQEHRQLKDAMFSAQLNPPIQSGFAAWETESSVLSPTAMEMEKDFMEFVLENATDSSTKQHTAPWGDSTMMDCGIPSSIKGSAKGDRKESEKRSQKKLSTPAKVPLAVAPKPGGHCKVCKKYIHSDEEFRKHRFTAKHRSAVEKQAARLTRRFECHVCQKKFDSVDQLRIHDRRHRYDVDNRMVMAKPKEASKLHIPTAPNDKDVSCKAFNCSNHCVICDMHFNGIRPWEDHVKGRTHQAQQRSQRQQRSQSLHQDRDGTYRRSSVQQQHAEPLRQLDKGKGDEETIRGRRIPQKKYVEYDGDDDIFLAGFVPQSGESKYESRYQDDFDHKGTLGRGGYGVVFQARNKMDDREYAVKRIALKNTELETMMREVKALAKLEHPHIVRYHNSWRETPPCGWQEEADRCAGMSSVGSESMTTQTGSTGSSGLPKLYVYIQMELCRRDSLKEWLSNDSVQRDEKQQLTIFQQIVKAVEYIHGEGMMHRDLKPSNIFFGRNGDVKVGDFGLVTALEEQTETEQTQSCSTQAKHTKQVGTTLYMSPEQTAGKDYTQSVDIYALGVIFFELFYPFEFETENEVNFYAFGTEMERRKTLVDIRNLTFPECFTMELPNKHAFVKPLLSHDPAERPTTAKILENLELQLCEQQQVVQLPADLELCEQQQLAYARKRSVSF